MSNPNDTKVVLQINSVAVLERLLGGDGAVELDIRNSIVQNFATRHLKPLMNGNQGVAELVKTVKESVVVEAKRDIEAFAGTFTKEGNWGAVRFQLSQEIKDNIKSFVDSEVRNIIRDTTQEMVEAWDTKRLEELIEARANQEFNRRVTAAVDAKFAEIKKQL